VKQNAVLFIALSGFLLIGAQAVSVSWDIKRHPECPICGMDRQRYAQSRMLIDYKEGAVGTCSIFCASADIAVNRQKHVQGIAVADYGGRELIPAQTATWVIGGNRSGVMTQRAKWAFGKRADAEAFITQHGGSLSSFDDAVKATFEDMYTDIKAIRERTQQHKGRSTRQEPIQSPATREMP
jgi:nitrous oxide reductase accessory protein NosL